MIGDTAAADAFHSSERFVSYWENSQALSGSLLVYNTGRSLGQFVELMKRCDGKVAVPDAIITAVGTKVGVAFQQGAIARTLEVIGRCWCKLQ
jgi:hypothetical protein